MNEKEILRQAGFPNWTSDFRHTDGQFRNIILTNLIENLKNYSNYADRNAGSIIYNELKKQDLIGLAPNLYYIGEKDKNINVIKFFDPIMVYFLKKFPAMVFVSANIEENKKSNVGQFEDVPLWVKIFLKANPQERKSHFEICLEGIRLYKHNPNADNKAGEILYTTLLSDEVDFIGYGLITTYFHIDDPQYQNFLRVHDHGGATLIFKYKNFPAYLITSPSLRFNDSHIKNVKLNEYNDEVLGITD